MKTLVKKIFCTALAFCLLSAIPAQNADAPIKLLNISITNVSYIEALGRLSSAAGVKFSFNPDILPQAQKVTIKAAAISLEESLEKMFKDTDVSYKIVGKKVILFKKRQKKGANVQEVTKEKHTLSGYVSDAATGEKLIGAAVYDEVSRRGMYTNEYGFYSLTLPAGMYNIKVSYLGYVIREVKLDLDRDKELHIDLKGEPSQTEEVKITAEVSEVKKARMSMISVPVEEIASLPALGGEVDILRTLQLMPGVQNGSEGSSGMFVRGGFTGSKSDFA